MPYANRADTAANNRAYYAANKERLNRRTLARIQQRRSEWFAGRGCAKCGSTEDLEADHIDPATKVSSRIWTWGDERRSAELAKCQPLCGPCHREKTAEENRRRFKRP